MKLPWDLEATPLQIKTDSALGSGEMINVRLYDKDGSDNFVTVKFSSSIQYRIYRCTNQRDLPVQPPVEVDKIWTINKTETALIITCNNVEVLNFLFADGSGNDCVTKLGGDVVEKILFHDFYDTASDFYRAGKARIFL